MCTCTRTKDQGPRALRVHVLVQGPYTSTHTCTCTSTRTHTCVLVQGPSAQGGACSDLKSTPKTKSLPAQNPGHDCFADLAGGYPQPPTRTRTCATTASQTLQEATLNHLHVHEPAPRLLRRPCRRLSFTRPLLRFCEAKPELRLLGLKGYAF